MITLMLHITLGLASLGFGAAALIKTSSHLLKVQTGAFVGTILTGVGLVAINPASLTHLCVSGTVFSVMSLLMMASTRRRLTVARQAS